MKLVSEELMEYISTRNVVTTKEVVDKTSQILDKDQESGYVYKKFLYPLQKKGYVERIRQSLYHVTTPGKQDSVVDKFLVASRVRDDYYIGFHAALEYYGVAYSYRNQIHICVKPKDRFDEFSYQNTVYTPYLTRDVTTGVLAQSYRGERIKVCSKERLFLECLKHPELVGGWEEVLKSLQSLGGLDFDELIDLLSVWDSQALIRRVGVTLELLRDESIYYRHLDNAVIDRIHGKVEGTPQYLIRGKKGRFDERWRIYIPVDFNDYLRAV